MLDVFKTNAFTEVSLTAGILKAPFKPSRIAELKLFREMGIRTKTAVVEEMDGQLSLIQTSPRGGPASKIGNKKRTARAFIVPHLERESTIYADEVQDVRAFGTESAVSPVQAVVDERLAILRAMHEVTLEHQRISAIQGIVKDADRTTLFNLFDEFEVSQQTATVSPDPENDNGNVLKTQVIAAQRLIEAELGAASALVSGYRAFCGAGFFDDFMSDLGVTQTQRWANPRALMEQQANIRRFDFAGVTWEEYRGSTPDVDGDTSPFVADGEAYLFPEGVPIFDTYFAPADFIEAVNSLGLPMYAKSFVDDELQRWAKIHTQSNPLSLCLRPRAVVKVTIST